MNEKESRRLARIAGAIAPESPIDQSLHAACIYQTVRKFARVPEREPTDELPRAARAHVPEQEEDA